MRARMESSRCQVVVDLSRLSVRHRWVLSRVCVRVHRGLMTPPISHTHTCTYFLLFSAVPHMLSDCFTFVCLFVCWTLGKRLSCEVAVVCWCTLNTHTSCNADSIPYSAASFAHAELSYKSLRGQWSSRVAVSDNFTTTAWVWPVVVRRNWCTRIYSEYLIAAIETVTSRVSLNIRL